MTWKLWYGCPMSRFNSKYTVMTWRTKSVLILKLSFYYTNTFYYSNIRCHSWVTNTDLYILQVRYVFFYPNFDINRCHSWVVIILTLIDCHKIINYNTT